MITENTDHNGDLNVDAFQRAVLSYRNTPSPDSGVSPAVCLFGHPTKDFIPVHRNRYMPHFTWYDTLNKREEALRNRHQRMQEVWNEHTKSLPPLKVGDFVRVQNQVGNKPRKWDKTGVVVEVRQYDQYIVKIDGSNRATLRNRRFLRKYEPMLPLKPRAKLIDKIKAMPEVYFRSTSPESTNHPDTLGKGQNGRVVEDCDQNIECDSPTVQEHLPKVPLAVRRLDDFNEKGLKEHDITNTSNRRNCRNLSN